jgi:homogentisate phytyltransferase/homogentisate geranylgeranyltransferase
VYSLEPFRLKRSALWAAACIASVRGVVVNLLVFLHFSGAPLALPAIPPRIWALTSVVLGISLVIAWYKDIPDIRGDREFGIWTLSVKLGPRRVVVLGGALLTACYVLISAAGFMGLPGVNPMVLAVSHLGLLVALWLAIRGVNLTDPASIRGFYLFIWGLFFAEYLAFPAACLLT